MGLKNKTVPRIEVQPGAFNRRLPHCAIQHHWKAAGSTHRALGRTGASLEPTSFQTVSSKTKQHIKAYILKTKKMQIDLPGSTYLIYIYIYICHLALIRQTMSTNTADDGKTFVYLNPDNGGTYNCLILFMIVLRDLKERFGMCRNYKQCPDSFRVVSGFRVFSCQRPALGFGFRSGPWHPR